MDPKERMEAIAQMAGAVADDFRSLLATILDHAAQLDGDLDPDDPRARSVAGIRHAAQLGASLSDQLLTFGHKQVLQSTVLDLNGLVQGTRRMLQRVVGDRVTFRTVTAPALRRVRANVNQIEEMLVNLAANARDAMPDGGTLTIETGNVTIDEATARERGVRPGDYVTVAVIDEGVGIDETVRSHLFEPFFTTKRRDGGTGLGLATVYGIVMQSGGHLLVDSEIGRGARFTVFLPAAPESSSIAATMAAPVAAHRGIETILLVEDDAAVRSLVTTVLGRRGYTVVVAEGADDAVRIAREHAQPIDLAISADSIAGIRVIQLPKPFTPDALARNVRAALERA
jgi:two-component system, cell cycle sensor histidine kinase and response regulator CckA